MKMKPIHAEKHVTSHAHLRARSKMSVIGKTAFPVGKLSAFSPPAPAPIAPQQAFDEQGPE